MLGRRESSTQFAILRYHMVIRRDTPVAEFIDPIASGSSLSLLGSLVGAAALGIFALWQNDAENDDDDSSPGGGLMQPVA